MVEVARVAADAANLEHWVRCAVAAVQEEVGQDVLADSRGPRREPAVPPTTVCVDWSSTSSAAVPAHWWSWFLRGPARERRRP